MPPEGKTYLWAADLQQVNVLPADVHVVGEVSQEDGHAVLHVLWNQSVSLDPEVLVCRNTHTRFHNPNWAALKAV